MKKLTRVGLLLIALLSMLVASCSKKSAIKGTLPEGVDQSTFVVLYNAQNNSAIDSVQSQDGKYEFDLKDATDPNALYYLQLNGDDPKVVWVIPEAGQITINPEFTFAEGTPLNDQLAALYNELKTADEEFQALMTKEDVDKDALKEAYDKYVAQAKEKIKAFFTAHKEHPVALVALQIYRNYVGELTDAKAMLEELGTAFDDYNYVKTLRSQIEAFDATQAGKPFTDLEGIRFVEQGTEPFKLSEYVGQGQYAIIDFWASWCNPCREEIKTTLKPLYEKYRDKGLVVVGIVVWDKEEDHKKAVDELQITWPQLFDPNATELAPKYAVYSIPQILLIGPDGTILARDLRGEELVKAVESHFN